MSREAIIRQIVGRDLANQDLSEETIRSKESALYEIACEEFGSWETALAYAGVDPKHAETTDRKWTKERVEQQLRRLCTTGYDLNAMVNRARNRPLYEAVLHFHGSWRGGLAAAGINLAHLSRRQPKRIDNETMVLWLKERASAEQTLVWTEVCLENREQAFAIRRRFGSWTKALQAAGLSDSG
ncbi:MAG: homing endonuclease associated repeat-containing protein [Aureliella sp.]